MRGPESLSIFANNNSRLRTGCKVRLKMLENKSYVIGSLMASFASDRIVVDYRYIVIGGASCYDRCGR